MQSTYNPWLVALSIAVAVLVSFTALRLAGRVADAKGTAGRTWLILGALSMGVGIWSMHFVGMLAFSLPVELRYEVGPTLLSLLIAILTSGFAIRIAASSQLRLGRHLVCSLVMGSGIAAMHYTGMSAIPIVPGILYDPALVAVSIIIAVVASFAALRLTFSMREGGREHALIAHLVAAVVMGSAIAGMHYTAMAASRFQTGAFCSGGLSLDNRWLAVLVGVATFAILAITLVLAIFDAHLDARSRLHAQRLDRANARLLHQAAHDALTDLPNRASFIDRLQSAIRACAESKGLLAVMLIDLDRFKVINDSLGHGFGDAVLKEVALRLKAAVAERGFAARLGGDEFLVLAEVRQTKEVSRIADEIVRRLSKTYLVGSMELYLAASVGITTYPFDQSSPEVLISHANEAMYDIKHDGGHGYRFFVPGTTVFTPDRLQLESDLRRAADLGQFELHYQPVVEVASGQIRGLEALLRWRHPERGFVPPAEFIPLAEASDAIIQIGQWVLQEACRQTRIWLDQGFDGLSIAVNLSARQFRQPDLLAMIQAAVAHNGLEPRHLVIELTESVVMRDADRSIRVLDELSRTGYQIAIDDFGTGYSSMNYLKQLPVGKLKIDRSFIKDLGSDPKSDSIIRSIIALAHGLGVTVVAEGVETRNQLSALLAYGCDQYQGYFCSRPRSAAEIGEYLWRDPQPVEKVDLERWLVGAAG
ncbi:MAG TPA: EAL domain-containing protein [Steroidobacteraceae bacterium]|nr:EAL domain-containing protein [Steroidobacteraceae bacterium]